LNVTIGRAESVGDGVESRIIHHTTELALIWAGVRRVAVKDLSDGVDATCCGLERPPEASVDLLHAIDAKPIDYDTIISAGREIREENTYWSSPRPIWRSRS
jgi:hypothetical protein